MKRSTLVASLLIIVTLAVYWQVGSHEFLLYDDDVYVTNNLHVTTGLTPENIKWAFAALDAQNWHPLTWLSHQADCQIYGLHPGGHHLTSLFLHAANTLLLFILLSRLTGALWRSAFVAALFALHPLHVESVAWVAERKDVLSAMFWMLALLAYARYVERPGVSRYALALLAFGLGLLAKPMLVTLPFVLLLLDYWPLGRLRDKGAFLRLLREKLPFMALSAASCLVTYFAQQKGGAVNSLEVLPLISRLENALIAYATYVVKMVWPAGLAVFYPLVLPFPAWQLIGASLLLVGISLLAVMGARRCPSLLFGWLWYLGTLVPVIGLVQVGLQSLADRYTYIPLIGLFIMGTWGVSDLTQRWRYQRTFLAVAALTLLVALTFRTYRQAALWRDSHELFSHAAAVTRNNYVAYTTLGNFAYTQGNFQEAVRYFSQAVMMRPDKADLHYNLGLALLQQRKDEEAMWNFAKAVSIRPAYAEAHYEIGLLLAGQGRIAEAVNHLMKVLQSNPDHVNARYNLGVAYARLGKIDQAVGEFSEILRTTPGHTAARRNLDICLERKAKMK